MGLPFSNGIKEMSKYSKIPALFDITVAKSKGVDSYPAGEIPFVTSSTLNNGVVAYVTPDDEDRTFEGPALVVSGLGYATVQLGTFLPKGNGGDSLTVLTPRAEIAIEKLLRYAAAFNSLHGWRFSFGRKCSVPRLKDLELPDDPPEIDELVAAQRDAAEAILEGLADRLKETIEHENEGDEENQNTLAPVTEG